MDLGRYDLYRNPSLPGKPDGGSQRHRQVQQGPLQYQNLEWHRRRQRQGQAAGRDADKDLHHYQRGAEQCGAVLCQCRTGPDGVFGHGDEGDRHLPEHRVRAPDDCHLADAYDTAQNPFDLRRTDVLAADLEDVLVAFDERLGRRHTLFWTAKREQTEGDHASDHT